MATKELWFFLLTSAISIVTFFTALPRTGTYLKFKTHCCRMARIKTAAPVISLCTTPTPVAPEHWAWRLSMRCPATLHATVPFPVSPTNSHLSHSSSASLQSIKRCSATLPIGGGDSTWCASCHVSSVFSTWLTLAVYLNLFISLMGKDVENIERPLWFVEVNNDAEIQLGPLCN